MIHEPVVTAVYDNIDVSMHHMDASKMDGEKARWELHKNAMYSFEQILKATPHKIAALAAINLPSQNPSK